MDNISDRTKCIMEMCTVPSKLIYSTEYEDKPESSLTKEVDQYNLKQIHPVLNGSEGCMEILNGDKVLDSTNANEACPINSAEKFKHLETGEGEEETVIFDGFVDVIDITENELFSRDRVDLATLPVITNNEYADAIEVEEEGQVLQADEDGLELPLSDCVVSIPEEAEETVELHSSDCVVPVPEEAEETIEILPSDCVVPVQENAEEETGKCASFEGRPSRGRKRKYADQTRQSRKKYMNTNKPYISSRGVPVEPKEFRDFVNCRCRCSHKVSLDERKIIFNKFWGAGSYEARCLLIGTMVSQGITKRSGKATHDKKRHFSRVYTLGSKKTPVCKPFFLQTLRISSCMVHRAMSKVIAESPVKDKRGSMGGHNAIKKEREEEVVNHISNYPRYISHYSRSTNNDQFLPAETTLPIMYNMYKEEIDEPVSFATYKKMFYTRFNLKRKPLKKDTCSICDSFSAQLKNASTENQKTDLKGRHFKHLFAATTARDLMKKNMLEANKTVECLTFDLEKTLPLPRIPTNVVYYKRQLMLYNCGIHSGSANKGFCYCWLEGEAGRGAQEVGSCLRQHLVEECPEIRELTLWSDSCGGQNRNIRIVLLLKAVIEEHPTLQCITQRFLVSGHSFLPNDSDFGDIESALKYQQRIYTAVDYMNIMKSCRKKNPLTVKEMKKQHFVGTEKLETMIVNRKHDTDRNKINWLQIRELKITRVQPYSIFIKTDFTQINYVEINLQKKKSACSTIIP